MGEQLAQPSSLRQIARHDSDMNEEVVSAHRQKLQMHHKDFGCSGHIQLQGTDRVPFELIRMINDRKAVLRRT